MYFLKLITFISSLVVGPRFSFLNDSSFELMALRHALSTPLTILVSSLDEIERSRSQIEVRKYKQALRTLCQLTDNFSRSKQALSSHEVLDIVSEVKLLLETKHKHVKVVTTKYSKSLDVFQVNSIRLKEALVCLVKNALESSAKSSKVVIELVEFDKKIVVSVTDCGSGISWWKLRLIEAPLISFKNGGSGIGLPFAKSVIEKELGGKMIIASQVGRGTRVECVIPKYQSTYSQNRA